MIKNNTKLTKTQFIIMTIALVIILFFIFSNKFVTKKLIWEQTNTGLSTLTVNTIIANTNNQSILYAGTNTGIFKSINKGKSWTAINNGLSNPLPNIKKILYSFSSKTIFALSEGGNLFESLDEGNNWIFRGAYFDDIALKSSLNGTGFGEKIYILKNSWEDNPIIYSIDIGIGFFSEPQQETRTEINLFYKDLYKNQDKINRSNKKDINKLNKLIGKAIENNDLWYNNIINVIKINFLRKKEEKLPNGTLNIGEHITSILSQNSVFTWIQTDKMIYFCNEGFIFCEKNNFLRSLLKKEKINNIGNFVVTSYSQIGIPHIYIGLGFDFGKLLINTCLNVKSSWILNNSLGKLGFSPIYLFVYSRNNSMDSSGCYNKVEKEKYKIPEYLDDIVFAIAKNKKQNSVLLVSKDNAKKWTLFKGDLPKSIKSIFATETYDGYNIYLTTTDNGIFRTSINLKDLR